ncbi:MAG: hypothetical protein Q9168_002715 [Polycauliona sp. 1 TL-2023]
MSSEGVEIKQNDHESGVWICAGPFKYFFTKMFNSRSKTRGFSFYISWRVEQETLQKDCAKMNNLGQLLETQGMLLGTIPTTDSFAQNSMRLEIENLREKMPGWDAELWEIVREADAMEDTNTWGRGIMGSSGEPTRDTGCEETDSSVEDSDAEDDEEEDFDEEDADVGWLEDEDVAVEGVDDEGVVVEDSPMDEGSPAEACAFRTLMSPEWEDEEER